MKEKLKWLDIEIEFGGRGAMSLALINHIDEWLASGK